MKTVELTKGEINKILWYLEPRLKTAEYVLSENYQEAYWKDLSEEHKQQAIEDIKDELQLLEDLIKKLKEQ